MAGIQQTGILALQPQEPVDVPTPPEGSFYMFVNIFDGITYYKDSRKVCTPVANISTLTLPPYQNDVAAGLGGLTTGMLYQSDGTDIAPLNIPGIVLIKQ